MKRTWPPNCVWTDERGALHISVPDMLDELGVPDTPVNRARCQHVTVHILEELLKHHAAVIKITS